MLEGPVGEGKSPSDSGDGLARSAWSSQWVSSSLEVPVLTLPSQPCVASGSFQGPTRQAVG